MDSVDLVLRQHFLSLHLSDFICRPVCMGNVLDKFIAGAHTTEKNPPSSCIKQLSGETA